MARYSAPAPVVVIPPAVFSAMLRSRIERTRREQAQIAPWNDGRTGYIVNFFA